MIAAALTLLTFLGYELFDQVQRKETLEARGWTNKARQLIQQLADANDLSYQQAINLLNSKNADAQLMQMHIEPSIRRAGRQLANQIQKDTIEVTQKYNEKKNELNRVGEATDVYDESYNNVFAQDKKTQSQNEINEFLNKYTEDFKDAKISEKQ